MGDIVFNIAKGRGIELHNRVANSDPANSVIVVVLLKLAETDANLKDHETLGALLAAAGNTEADFTNYARIVLSDADISEAAPDHGADTQSVGFANQTWASAGGTTDNTLFKIIVCYDPDSTGGDDTDLVPLTGQDFSATTDGNDLIASLTNYFRAA